jgi:hypothetical protein
MKGIPPDDVPMTEEEWRPFAEHLGIEVDVMHVSGDVCPGCGQEIVPREDDRQARDGRWWHLGCVSQRNVRPVSGGGPLTPAKLRAVADWLDTLDAVARAWMAGEAPKVAPNAEAMQAVGETATEVQDDLRRWADELDVRPISGEVVPPMPDPDDPDWVEVSLDSRIGTLLRSTVRDEHGRVPVTERFLTEVRAQLMVDSATIAELTDPQLDVSAVIGGEDPWETVDQEEIVVHDEPIVRMIGMVAEARNERDAAEAEVERLRAVIRRMHDVSLLPLDDNDRREIARIAREVLGDG